MNEIKAITYDLVEDSLIKESLKAIGYHSNEKLINYFMPADWYYSDLPMEVPADKKGHFTPDNWQKDKFKILITKVLSIKKEPNINAKYILLKTQRRIPVIVVIWDRCKKKIVGYENVPATVRWGDIPTPLF